MATLVFACGGWVFIKGAIGELADRRPGMMTLIALAISLAFAFSLAVTFGFPGMDLWWESEGRKQKCFLLSARFEIRVQLGHDGIDCRSVSYSDVPRVRPSELLWLASAIEERDDRCGRELLIVSRGDHE